MSRLDRRRLSRIVGDFGQLSLLVRGRFLVDALPYTKVEGLPFSSDEIEIKVNEVLQEVQS